MPDDPEPITERRWQELRGLLPLQMNSPASTDTAPSSFWTPEEVAKARQAQIHRLIQSGWKVDANGLLSKGRATIRPSAPIPAKVPGELGYSPHSVFALHLGATLIEAGPWAGRYRLGKHVVDWLGRFVDTDACPECGSGHGEYRFKVKMFPNPNPFAQPWEQAFTYCRRCCSPEEIAELRRQPTMPPAKGKSR